MTKVIYGTKRRKLVGNILYDIYDDYPKPQGQDQPIQTA
jgi:hypothetical protein